MQNTDKYAAMQRDAYEADAKNWTTTNRDPVVGSFDKHNQWADYNTYLFKGIDTSKMMALDFGCGPGRCIVLYRDRFKDIDGADIAIANLEKAAQWIGFNKQLLPKLYHVDGKSLTGLPTNAYDMVYSTICMQHICVHSTRYAIMEDMLRVLKPSGYICIQMGYGGKSKDNGWANYFDDMCEADKTNGGYDVSIASVEDLYKDLSNIGFTEFSYDIRPTGPGDNHRNWIFFRARKP